MLITGVAPSPPLTPLAPAPQDPAVPASAVVRALVAFGTPDSTVPVDRVVPDCASLKHRARSPGASHDCCVECASASEPKLLCPFVLPPAKPRPKCAMAGVRVGEASHPGPGNPKRARSEGPVPEGRDADFAPLPVRRRRQGKQQVPSQELAVEDAWIAEFDEPESPAALGSTDDAESAAPGSSAALGSRDVPMSAPRPSMKVSAHRLAGTQALVGATYLGDKKVWRWQVRSHPPFAGTERQHPADSLEAFIRSHADKFDAVSLELLHSKVTELRTYSVDSLVPSGPKRVRVDMGRHDLVSIPTELLSPAMESVPSPIQDATHTGSRLPSWELHFLMANRLPVQRHLPPSTLAMLSQVIVSILKPCPPEDDAAARRRALLFVLPKVIWPSAAVSPDGTRPRGRQRQRRIAQRMTRALDGDWISLCEESRSWAIAAMQVPHGNDEGDLDPDEDPEPSPLSASQAQRILREVMKGSQSAALTKIDAPPLAAVTKQNWDVAWDKLHPNAPTLPPACDDTVPVWSPPASNWHHAVMHLRDAKAVDPGGWSHEIMKTLWANPIARVSLQSLVG